MTISHIIRKNLVNLPGWRTTRKILVIESDDWGSIRIPSRKVYEYLLSKRVPVDSFYFTKNDCLESERDLLMLFEILGSFTDINGAHAVITANSVVVNPDFKKITKSGKTEYHYELISDTYSNYPEHAGVMNLWKESGMKNKLLWPQFHGREHLNVKFWMQAINSDSRSEKLAFENNTLLGIDIPGETDDNHNYMAALDYDSPEQMAEVEPIVSNGLVLFKDLFGFASKSFIAPCSIQGEHIDSVLLKGGVNYHQSGQQFRPIGNGGYKIINKFWGQQNNVGQIYWRRNCTFEPSRNHDFDWVDSCLAEMKVAFRWGKPAVINSHRVNYIGSIFPENREKTLISLKKLLKSALEKWPDIEFMTSDDLGDVIAMSL